MGFGRGLKFILALFFLACSLFYFAPSAQAHFIENDGPVLIMLHASHDDNPIIGEATNLTFYITDSQKRFKAQDCDCQLNIYLNDQIVFSTTTFDNVKNNPVFSYIFPQKGIYTVKFTAKPLVDGTFHSFKLNYDMRVERTMEQATAAKASMNRYRLYLVLVTIVLLLVVFNYKKLKKGLLSIFVLLVAFSTVLHQPQIRCPEHAQGIHGGQHECCFIPLIENNPRLITTPLSNWGEAKTIKLERPSKTQIISGLNNKSPPRQAV